jgi:hypothetical protein
VLLLDAHDAYGGSWASLSGGDFVHSLLNTSLRAKQQHQQGEGDGTSIRQAPADVSAACTVVQQDAPLARAQHAATLVKPQLQEALQDRGLIVDLTPRVRARVGSWCVAACVRAGLCVRQAACEQLEQSACWQRRAHVNPGPLRARVRRPACVRATGAVPG